MSKLDTRTRWMVVVGSWFVVRVLPNIARANPSFAPFVVPIMGIYFVFVLLTWVADPLFNLLLRLNRYGRLILAPDEIQASNWVGGSIGLALVAGVLLLVTQSIAAGVALFVFGLLIVPLAATFHCSGRSRQIMAIYTGVLTAVGLMGIFLALIQGALTGLAGLAAGLFFLGVYASSWIANILMTRRSPR